MRIWKLYKVCWDNNKKRKRSSRRRSRKEEERRKKKTGQPFNKFQRQTM
jgi:hypothetical protein